MRIRKSASEELADEAGKTNGSETKRQADVQTTSFLMQNFQSNAKLDQ
jgi:hypothetical protein